jgi:DnaJ-class molecular chaperone
LNYDFERAFKDFDEQKKSNQKNNISKKLQNSYKLLDLDLNSSLDEIKGKYKVLAKKWHPDVQKKEEAEYNQNKFIDITNAYKAILKSFTETKK